MLSFLSLDIEDVGDGAEAFGLLLARRFDLLVADLNMTPISAAQLVMAVRLLPAERRPKIIVCSPDPGAGDATAREALRQADCILATPVSIADLLAAVQKVLPAALNSTP